MHSKIGGEIVEEAILEQDVMGRLVGQAGQLMLPCADQNDGSNVTGTFHQNEMPDVIW